MNGDFFQFEADFVNSLHCIPMQVRMKLDTCGIKLKLSHWNHFSHQERQALVKMPCTKVEETQAYRDFLQNLVLEKTGIPAKELSIDPHPPWIEASTIPTNVREKATEFGVKITLKQWANLTNLQRFALIKLSRPSHENKNFLPALKEFNLTSEY
ncbi:MAG: nitrate reductase associated protein [Prochloraceae cyanobacterium]